MTTPRDKTASTFIATLSLDEDSSQDEVYATARIMDPVYGATTFKTNVVVGDF